MLYVRYIIGRVSLQCRYGKVRVSFKGFVIVLLWYRYGAVSVPFLIAMLSVAFFAIIPILLDIFRENMRNKKNCQKGHSSKYQLLMFACK